MGEKALEFTEQASEVHRKVDAQGCWQRSRLVPRGESTHVTCPSGGIQTAVDQRSGRWRDRTTPCWIDMSGRRNRVILRLSGWGKWRLARFLLPQMPRARKILRGLHSRRRPDTLLKVHKCQAEKCGRDLSACPSARRPQPDNTMRPRHDPIRNADSRRAEKSEPDGTPRNSRGTRLCPPVR